MSCHLVLPGLLWPATDLSKPAADLSLPALAALLGHAQVGWTPGRSVEAWLAAHFGLAERPPYAALRRRGELEAMPPGGHWLCVDPVHLHFARDKLLLAAGGELAITRAEADLLIAGLNDTFADIGRFEAAAPDRWYLHSDIAIRPLFHPLVDVAGRPVELFMPEGEDVSRWARLANELQVWLHVHPLNAARESAGQPAINSCWLWGAGDAPLLRRPAAAVYADDPLALGLARAAGITPTRPTRFADIDGDAAGDILVVLSTLQPFVLRRDSAGWREALATLERDWFAPLWKALKAGRIKRLVLSAPGDGRSVEMTIEAATLWKFWRKPLTLAALIAAAPTPSSATP